MKAIQAANIIKIIKKGSKNKARERYQNLSIEEKEKRAAIWLWTIQKSTSWWKTKVCWVYIMKLEKTPPYNYKKLLF